MQWKLIRLPQYKLESDHVFGTVFPSSHFAALSPGPSSVRSLCAQGWCCPRSGFFFVCLSYGWSSPPLHPTAVGAVSNLYLDLGDPVVSWRVWVLSVKLSELLQTAYRKVVEWLFRPVLSVWIVEPFHEVHDVAPVFGVAHDLIDIVFLALLDIVCLPKHLGWVGGCSVFADSVGLEQRHMKDVVDLPFSRQGEADSEGRDNFLHLKVTMILVVQLSRRSARSDVAPVEHNQVPDLLQ